MAQGEQLHISTWPAIWPTRVTAQESDASRISASQSSVARGAQYDNFAANRTRAAAHCFEAKCFGVLCTGKLGQDAIEAISSGPGAISPQAAKSLETAQQSATMFLDPTGAPLQGFVYENGSPASKEFLQKEEDILYADMDLTDCIEGKQYHDVVGGYQRLDVFDLKVNRTRQHPIQFVENDPAPEPRFPRDNE